LIIDVNEVIANFVEIDAQKCVFFCFNRKNYADIALKGSQGSGCCSNSNCCCDESIGVKEASMNIGYSKDDLEKVPARANMDLGCCNPKRCWL